MSKGKSTWVDVVNHGPHRFVGESRVSACKRVVRTSGSTPLPKAPAEGCAGCGGKQPAEQQPSTGSTESGNTGESGQ